MNLRTHAVRSISSLLLAILLVAGCATNPPPKHELSDAGPSSVQAEASGLEPAATAPFNKLTLSLVFGTRDSVRTWKVSIVGATNAVADSFEGDATNLPDTLQWDGSDSGGRAAAEGQYTAKLDVDYGDLYKPGTAQSKPFTLVRTPPSGSFSPNPALFAYNSGKPPAPITIQVTAKESLARIKGWSLDAHDASGALFKSWSGNGTTGTVTWDGTNAQGALIPPTGVFAATLTVTDEYGGIGTFPGSFAMSDKPSAPLASLGPRRAGFSPTSASVKNTIDILLAVPAKADVTAWKMEIDSVTKGSIRSFQGDGASLPDFVRWDGKDSDGVLMPQGPYYSVLRLSYGDKYKDASVRGPGFSLVLERPTGSVTVDPAAPDLASLGPKSPIHFTVQAKSSYARIAKWTLTVLDPDKSAVALFKANWPNNKVDWDGKTADGGMMKPGMMYTAIATVEDEYGNVGTLSTSITVDPLKPADEPSSITAAGAGFAPKGDGTFPSMGFTVEAGDPASVASWKVEILDASGAAVRTFPGSAAKVPGSLSWDGKIDSGAMAQEGSYSARLSIDYGFNFAPNSVSTQPFALDLTPPKPVISLSSKIISPDGDGSYDTETIGLDATAAQRHLTNWSITILDPGSNPFIAFKGNWPASAVVWDGKGTNGDLVESASDYTIVAKVRDEFGSVGEARAIVGTDIMVIKTDQGYRISVSSIVFKPFTADYHDVPTDRAQRNLQTLDLLAASLKKFPDYRIALQGHAVMVNWDDKAKGAIEQRDELIPLSLARAQAVADALVERGIDRARFEVIGLGALNPIVPDSDYPDRWKNRRVEFLLIK